MARPTKFEDWMHEKVIELGKLGKSCVGMAAAIGISKRTFFQWVADNEEFSHSVEIAKAYSQEWWEDKGQRCLTADKFQSTVYNRQMANRFREDHGEVKEVVQRQSGVISSEPLSAEEWEKLYSDDSESE